MEFYKEKTFFKWMRVCVIILLMAVVLSLGALILSYFLIRKNSERQDSANIRYYQSLVVNPHLNETVFGIQSSYRILPESGFYSFEREDGSFVMLSRFGSNEFQCTGSCSCLEKNGRRSAATIIGSRLTYLLVAVSSAIAYQRAEDYFKEKCHKELADSCSMSSTIESDVDECIEPAQNDGEGKYSKYLCRGNCKPNKFFYNGLDLASEIIMKVSEDVKSYGCEQLEHQEYILPEEVDSLEERDEIGVGFHFMQKHLQPFCKKNSIKKLVLPKEKGKKRKKGKGSRPKISMCAASVNPEGMQEMCRKVS